jgi:ATPase subunit of ABC transporter with duplicated ATPase domains
LRQFNREKSIKRAESRVKALDKVERIDAPMMDSQKMVLSLEPDVRSGNDVLTVDGISKSYDGESLFENLSFSLHRQDRVAILGDNGTGKTTILKLITGRKDKDAGVITLGANVTVGYYDQEQQELDEEKTLFEEMQDAYPNLNDTRIRNVLAAFLFTGDEVFQPIKTLSGGERGRISLAKLMLSGANFLILDEPTSGLDPIMQEVFIRFIIEEKKRGKTILLSSHIFSEVDATCDTISIIKDGKHVSTFKANDLKNGTVATYIVRLADAKEAERLAAFKDPSFTVQSVNEKRKIVTLEVKREMFKQFFDVLSTFKIREFEEKPFTLQDYFMSFYAEERTFGGLAGVEESPK